MYINNPKKLFEDLYNIHTMEDYMDAVRDDGMKDDLYNMVSIIYDHKDALWDSQNLGGEGNLRWDLADFEGMKDEQKLRNEMIADSNKLKRIWRIIQKELNTKYVLICNNCGKEYFYSRKPVYDIERYICGECKTKGSLEIIPFDKWASPEIIRIKREYLGRN